jgi:uncharacterized protein
MSDVAAIVLLVVIVVGYLGASFGVGVLEGYKRAHMSGSQLIAKSTSNDYWSAGKRVTCPHCGGAAFQERQAQLNTWFATFLKLDWLNRSATTLICTACGHMAWFAQKPTKG